MGIFDRPKNYMMRKSSTIISYEERFQRLVEIINIVIDDIHNPLLNQENLELGQKINLKLSNLEEEFDRCRESENVNHQDLNNLAKEMRAYIFYVLKIYQNKHLNVTQNSDSKLIIEYDIYSNSLFSYDADRWMITINDEDLWYLGR